MIPIMEMRLDKLRRGKFMKLVVGLGGFIGLLIMMVLIFYWYWVFSIARGPVQAIQTTESANRSNSTVKQSSAAYSIDNNPAMSDLKAAQNVPLYTNAHQVITNGYTLGPWWLETKFNSEDSIQKVAAFYRNTLSKKGWETVKDK